MAQLLLLNTAPNQALSATLTIDGAQLQFQLTLSYNPTGFWVMGIADRYGNVILLGVPLLTGVWPAANILAPYAYLNIGSAFVISLSGAATDYPNNTNLGSQFTLLWDDTPAS